MAYKKYSSKTTSQDKYSDLAKSVADIFIKALEEETLPWQEVLMLSSSTLLLIQHQEPSTEDLTVCCYL